MSRKTFSGNGLEEEASIVFNPFGNSKNSFSQVIAQKHVFYINGEIGPLNDYVQMCHTIRTSSENDVIILYINSEGGDINTALSIVDAIEETDATCCASVSGMCYSAATLLFLACSRWEIGEHASFLFHQYRSAVMGKGGEMKDQIDFQHKWSENLIRSSYKDFLSESEIKQILAGKDLWMLRDEVGVRFEKRNAEMEKKLKEIEKEQKKAKKTKPEEVKTPDVTN